LLIIEPILSSVCVCLSVCICVVHWQGASFSRVLHMTLSKYFSGWVAQHPKQTSSVCVCVCMSVVGVCL